jgi:granule-bound starch synthase
LQTALCIHNIAFQGRFWGDDYNQLGLPQEAQTLFEFTDGYPKVFDESTPADESAAATATGVQYKKLNWLKAGILACDKLLTVSPNYATGAPWAGLVVVLDGGG